MRNVLGPGTILGYCTNVHAGATPAEMLQSLMQSVTAVKDRVAPKNKMGIGLWFSKSSAKYMFQKTFIEKDPGFRNGTVSRGLVPFTINGFPTGDFHADVVKHAVYEPDWSHEDRWGYTYLLAGIHTALVGEDTHVERSISTLPLGWRGPPCPPVDLAVATDRLLDIAGTLSKWRQESGLLIHVDLEPEPGCLLQRADDVVRFFKQHLLPAAPRQDLKDEDVLRHIRVCHDICHAAVMFEDQKEMFERYRAAGIQIGKVQISNAIRADLRNLSARERVDALAQLRQFAEDRYLHQTMIDTGSGMRFFDDLPKALDAFGQSDRAGVEWRVHFHVPVYLERFGLLSTTRDHIIECIRLLKGSEVKHWEVETYAWNVLPDELKVPDLAEGIAKELIWVRDTARQINESP